MNLQFAIGLRNDRVNGNELSSTLNRDSTLSRTQLGDIVESNYYIYGNADFYVGKLTINPGIRLDYFQYNYQDALSATYDPQTLTKPVVSPKLNFIYNFSNSFQAYIKSGIGFHSNDTRVVLERDNNKSILPRAYGADLGGIWKPTPRLIINGAGWYLFSEQEFVYVGDAGIVEPSGESERLGVDLGLRYQFSKQWFLDGDFTYSEAQAVGEQEGQNYIPLAPRITSIAGITYQGDLFNAGLRARYLQDRPANEDNSVVAKGYTVVDGNANYNFRNFTLGFFVENLFNVDWNEAQFDTESRIRLANGSLEGEPVSEIHFTPGTPFNWRLSLKYMF
jgi:outer membrane receptor for Fe3+-dicitrate